ncbi:MAG TPA: RecX family transcriptional regulator [Candidatus Onthovivens sp.]|nr:RecX family transcriptional regulator [Candidatus Onthovivens sp.]
MQLENLGNKSTYELIKIGKKKDPITIYFDDFKLKVPLEIFTKHQLDVGLYSNVLIEELLYDIEKYDLKKHLRALSLRKPLCFNDFKIIAYRQCRYKMVVEKSLNELVEEGVIDDLAFTKTYYKYLTDLNFGKYHIVNFFKHNKISMEIIEQLTFNEEKEKEKIINYFHSIKNKYAGTNFSKLKKALYEKMLLRGFDINLINEFLSSLKINRLEEQKALNKDFKKSVNKFINKETKLIDEKKIISSLIKMGYDYSDINNLLEELKETTND